MVLNQPYDETVEVSDGEEVPSNNPTPHGNERGISFVQQGYCFVFVCFFFVVTPLNGPLWTVNMLGKWKEVGGLFFPLQLHL